MQTGDGKHAHFQPIIPMHNPHTLAVLPPMGKFGAVGSACDLAHSKLPQWRPTNQNARPAHSTSTHSNVILNAVKDLQFPLGASKWRYFRIGDDPTTMPVQHLQPLLTAVSS
jgi:hypothetical protein